MYIVLVHFLSLFLFFFSHGSHFMVVPTASSHWENSSSITEDMMSPPGGGLGNVMSFLCDTLKSHKAWENSGSITEGMMSLPGGGLGNMMSLPDISLCYDGGCCQSKFLEL